MAALGKPPLEIIEHASLKSTYFDDNNEPIIRKNSRGISFYPGSRPLIQQFEGHDKNFVNFLVSCLEWIPEKRISAEEGLLHD